MSNLRHLVAIFLLGLAQLSCRTSSSDQEHLRIGTPASGEEIQNFNEALQARSTARLSEMPGKDREEKTDVPTGKPSVEEKPVEGGFQNFVTTTTVTARKLTEMILQDQATGPVFPGAFVWTGPLEAGRVEGLFRLEGDGRISVSLNNAYAGDREDDEALTLTYERVQSAYQQELRSALRNIKKVAPRLSITLKTSTSLESSLLQAGLSVSAWGTKFAASAEKGSTTTESVAVLTINQAYFDAVVDAPESTGWVPLSALKSRSNIAYLLKGLELNKDLGVVSKVTYGRSVIVVVRGSMQATELKMALSVASDWAHLDAKAKKEASERLASLTYESVAIGGKVGDEYAKLATGQGKGLGFLDDAYRFLSATINWDSDTIPVPISFQVNYAYDNSPLQIFESKGFAGTIPGRFYRGAESRLINDCIVQTDPVNATRTHGDDDEMGTDDYTGLEVRYDIDISSDKRRVVLKLTWIATELEKNQQMDGDNTQFTSSKEIVLFTVEDNDGRKIKEIEGVPLSFSSGRRILGGTIHGEQSYAGLGGLKDVDISLDGKGRNDKQHQSFRGKISITVHLDREKP